MKAGQEDAFEKAVAAAAPLFQKAGGARTLSLERSEEKPQHYRLVVGWETVEAHTVGFRGSEAFGQCRALIDEYLESTPEVEHVRHVLTALSWLVTVVASTTRHRERVTPDLSRSWLLVSARRTGQFFAASASVADQVVLDLGDGVDPAYKSQARAQVCDWLRNGGSAWVRVNVRGSDFWGEDLSQLVGLPGLLGIVLPKVESASDVDESSRRLDSAPVLALIESALGIEEAVGIARAERTFRLTFGSGDYRRDTGTSADALAMAYPRSRLVVAGRVGKLLGPVDGPTVSASHSVLREHTRTAVSLGMTGRLCLDATQAPVVNQVMSPAAVDVEWARGFIEGFERRDRVIQDGSDLPRLGRAERILQLAQAFSLD